MQLNVTNAEERRGFQQCDRVIHSAGGWSWPSQRISSARQRVHWRPIAEPVNRCLFGPGPLAQHASVFPNHHVESSSVSRGFKRYFSLSTVAESSEMMYLPVDQLHSRAESLVAKFEQGGGNNYIDEAIVLDREALQLCPPSHPERCVSLNQLGIHLCGRYNRLGAVTDLEEAIVLDRDALALCPPGHPRRSTYLNNLSLHLSTRYDRLGAITDLEEAIVIDRDALAIRPPGHPDRSISLNNLSLHLSNRYNQLGAMEDLDEGIVLARDALALCTERDPVLNNLSLYLSIRYNQLGAPEDLNEAIVLARDTLALCTVGHPAQPTSLNNLSVYLSTRYNRLGAMEDLNEAIVLARDAVALRPPGHPDRSISLTNLSLSLTTRYGRLGATEDLEEAIVHAQETLAVCTVGHPGRSKFLTNLSNCLSTRYGQLGVMEDLNKAIVLIRDALALCPPGHPDRSIFSDYLALRLSTRYKQLGVMEDLNEAIIYARETLVLCAVGHPGRSKFLNNLSSCLSTRYTQLGTMEDLNEVIVLARDALALCTAEHPGWSMFLSNLSVYLSIRYNQLGAMEDLNEAIVLARDAVALRPPGHPDRSTSLSNLSSYLSTRYDQLGAMEDLNEAIVLAQDAVALCSAGHPGRTIPLNTLSHHLSTRYNQLGAMEDLDEAILLARDALTLCPPGHPHCSTSLNNLSLHLSTRYDQLGGMTDLDEAIFLARDALVLCPPGHPDRSITLENLGFYFCTRFSRSSQSKDKEELFSLFALLAHPPPMVSSADLSAARTWIRVAEDFQHPTTLLAYQTSLRLLTHHVATLPPLPQHHTVLKGLTSSLAVDTFSACLRNCSPKNAVELLEQGRGVFWTQLTRLRSPLDDVIASCATGQILADEFTRQTLLIRTALDSPGADQHDRVCRLSVELQRVVTRIRELPGLSRFLLPSLFSDLQQAARGGPVIIVNASEYGCDALVVLVDQDPVHIPLPITRQGVRELSSKLGTSTVRAKSMDVKRELGIILRELWDDVVSPIVNFLRMVHPFQSRIWWCPTAEFSALPLHAAGPYRKGQQNLANLYISSYTPTLTALIRARRHNPPHFASKEKHFVGIGQAKAKGEKELVSVGAELTNIGRRVCGLATFTHIEGQESCIARVTEELRKNEWVHLACHGIPNRKHPFESAFALHDGHFTIERIIRCELENAQFAYLSACRTTVGDEDSPDEVLHLASAMQFAGFRSVIGTMWAVDDGETNKITSAFYDNMINESGRLDYTRAALALNRTMKKLVKDKDIPFDQCILYIHLGA